MVRAVRLLLLLALGFTAAASPREAGAVETLATRSDPGLRGGASTSRLHPPPTDPLLAALPSASARDTAGRPTWKLLAAAACFAGLAGVAVGIALGRRLARPSGTHASPGTQTSAAPPKPRSWHSPTPSSPPAPAEAPPEPSPEHTRPPEVPPPAPPGKKRAWEK